MSEKYTEEMKNKFLAMAGMMGRINRTVPVSGERFSIPAEGREIPVVYYRTKTEHAPLILGFHGGGFLFGGNALNDAMWSAVSETLHVNIASIGYRKSPDFQYRAALEDILAALRYFRSGASQLDFDPARIGAMGCSAGANLAATFCIYARQLNEEPLWKQIMLYPVVDMYTDPAEKEAGTLAQPLQYLFNDLHCTQEEAKLPVVSPLFAETQELRGLPDAIICTAEMDSLKKETEIYAQMLSDAGVKVSLMDAEDMPHGFFEVGFGKVSNAEIEVLGPEIEACVKSGKAALVSRQILEKIGSLL
ncbi:MAG: alpha/beta hydrolase fold domain-containing protein [Eubacterium sp.]|nr:alpha/beta hydrolase fold domain-containing protein [Eubacterium sp.]